MAMKLSPRTFQCACLVWACRSMAAARCSFSRATDLARMFSDRVFFVRYMTIRRPFLRGLDRGRSRTGVAERYHFSLKRWGQCPFLATPLIEIVLDRPDYRARGTAKTQEPQGFSVRGRRQPPIPGLVGPTGRVSAGTIAPASSRPYL